jgi:hypothetical protein
MQRFTHFVMVDNKVRAGAYSQTDAEKMAQLLGGKVEEAVIATLEGDVRVSSSNLLIDGQTIADMLLDELGVSLSSKTAAYDLGYCSILIKPAKGPDEDEGYKEK